HTTKETMSQPYGAISNGESRAENGISIHNDETQPLLAPKPGSRSWLRTRLGADVRRDWADIMLLACYIITGILDSASISTWGAFVSMQTGNTVYLGLGPTAGTNRIKLVRQRNPSYAGDTTTVNTSLRIVSLQSLEMAWPGTFCNDKHSLPNSIELIDCLSVCLYMNSIASFQNTSSQLYNIEEMNMNALKNFQSDVKNDVTWNRAARLSVKGAKALPSGTVQYISDKVPIVGWLPRYNLRWLINDLIAGLTLGLMLIPQGLSYAKIANIPVEYGLMSSWLPAVIYAFMGSTKDVSTGPTSLIGLLTSENVHALQDRWTPSEIASATAFMMGIYGMILGFLKLGFLLEFISLPVLSGFITAIAITIILNQMDSLLGEDNVRDGAAKQIHDIFSELPNANGWACLIGFTGILFLTILEKSGKRWSKDNKVIWLLSTTRAFLALVLFTGISYGVNKNREDYLFEVVKVRSEGQQAPTMPKADLIPEVAGRSIAVFIGSAVEHLAIARAFAVKNSYTSDQSQELCYLGITNFFNSFFHAMGVGGAMSRTAVNSSCNVKSPLSGVVTMAVVLVCVYELVGALFWIPKATLAAIIITAVWGLISPPSTFYRYWKTSLADFISSMLALWVTLFHSSEVGIGCAVGFNIVYILLRQVFTRLTSTGADVESNRRPTWALENNHTSPLTIPEDARIFTFNESIIFPNAFANTTKVLDEIQTYHAAYYSGSHGPETERNWSVVGEKRVARLRKKANISDPSSLPGIGLIVLDFSRVNMLDTTAVTYLKNLVSNIKSYGGDGTEVRFANMNAVCRERVARAGWRVIEVGGNGELQGDLENDGEPIYLYWDTRAAVVAPRRRGSVLTDDGKVHAVHEEEKAEV
ncbi:putative sulfate permease, partial [Fusarium culmorum]